MKPLVLFCFLCCLSAKANLCVSSSSGAWTNSSTWSCGSVPVCGDSIVIQTGHTVSLTAQDYKGCAQKTVLVIKGTLKFTGAGKLEFSCLGRVYIFSGGHIVSANGATGNSNAVMQCNSTWWNAGAGTYNGPGCMPPFLSGCAAVLPVELVSFDAFVCGNLNCITWETATEYNNAYFEVWRSEDGLVFTPIRTLYPDKDLQAARHHYETVDEEPFNGINYYRLKQFDKNGRNKLYPIVAVNQKLQALHTEIIPNPNNGNFTLHVVGLSVNELAHMTIYDSKSQVVFEMDLVRRPNESSIDVNTALPAGLYYAEISGALNREVRKLVVYN